MTLVASPVSSSTTATPAGKFYNDDGEDDGSVSSDSSESSSGSSSREDSDSDDDDDDDGRPTKLEVLRARNELLRKSNSQRIEKIKQSLLHSPNSDTRKLVEPGTDGTNDEEEMIKIRQRAFELINKAGGPSEEDKNSQQWPQSPQKYHYYQQQQQQQQSAGESSSYRSPYQQQQQHTSSSTAAYQQQQYPAAHTADKLSVTQLFVNCVTDVCKVSSSEIVSQGMSLLSSGYQSISNYRDAPLSGSYDPIDTSQHGYGNRNNHNHNSGNQSTPMRGRYQD
jgi:hypothetical protein